MDYSQIVIASVGITVSELSDQEVALSGATATKEALEACLQHRIGNFR